MCETYSSFHLQNPYDLFSVPVPAKSRNVPLKTKQKTNKKAKRIQMKQTEKLLMIQAG